MNKHTQNNVSTIAEDARALAAATVGVAGEKISEARKRVAASLENSKEIYGRAQDKAVEGVKAVGQALHEHPYQALGIALGIGAVIGFVVALRCCSNPDKSRDERDSDEVGATDRRAETLRD